ncbi:hypothetical protein VOLCADRAFT_91814 [Volvox carteri f. nagariensis]|uniref:Peptidase M11 gametolysin domain-containing protein n=1 Tax=Volvox carteri f. nagariensis TaxID=3068 RepID=D8TY10_VOLCA|nr:uncharacterized protein VOLCADRAFT_91814 [Volvox carteri f. nagariensis]EFJ47468.1 hypothetical protein VOLCADRAFT_91814 [Volvox carteri f. nagariensis]|eukprot:XP_002951292.1 hypothetical protein VOLCADRAFT_91814 [Volvox carteri f. nagariensis]
MRILLTNVVRNVVRTSLQGVYDKGTVMQALLNNAGLYPAWRDGLAYNDLSTAMGFGRSCPSAPELLRLDWASPLALLNSARFASRVYRSYTLPATYLGPTGVMIKIQPDWLGSAYTKNIYLALRVKAAGDSDLAAEFNGKLNVHEADKDVDNDVMRIGDPRISFVRAVDPGSSVLLFNYRLHILTGDLVQGNTMVIKICRFFSAGPNECVEGTSLPSINRLHGEIDAHWD